MEETTFLTRFLPDAIPLLLDSWELDDTTSLITLQVTSTPRDVPCPVCAMLADRLHSHSTSACWLISPGVRHASAGSSASASFSAVISSAPAVSSRHGSLEWWRPGLGGHRDWLRG
jgi:hypothetical protein